MVLGIYYLTYSDLDLPSMEASKIKPHPRRFDSADEIEVALEMKAVGLQEPIEFRFNEELHLTTAGRVLFNSAVYRALDELLPPDEELEFDFMNQTLAKPDTDRYVLSLSDRYGAHTLAPVLDTIKTLGFRYATKAGVTISKNDIVIPPDKEKILSGYEKRVEEVHGQYDMGLITEDERHETIVNIWTEATDEVASAMEEHFDELNPVFMMANSGARGSFKQIRQLAGMRGLMANPKGEIIERPIKANFMEGLTVLEYFISTHGARKGLADTALRTADSGYLTRRLVDVSQDVIVREHDCGTDDHIDLPIRTRRRAEQVAARPRRLGRRAQAARLRQAGQAVARREGRVAHARRCSRSSRPSSAASSHGPGPLGAEVPRRDGRVQDLLRHLPGDGRDVRDRRRGRHHRRAVDRRAGHAADDADVPHRRCRRRGHHARPPACRRDLRGAEPEGRRGARRGRRAASRSSTTERGPKITHPPDRGRRRTASSPIRSSTSSRAARACSSRTARSSSRATRSTRARRTRPTSWRSRARPTTELYLVGEVQKVYKSQGVEIHDKHIELIVRQMLKKVRVESNGDTDLLPGPARRQGRSSSARTAR